MADWIDHERARMVAEADAKDESTMLTYEEPDDFWADDNDGKEMPAGWWIVLVTIISLVVWWFFGRWLLK